MKYIMSIFMALAMLFSAVPVFAAPFKADNNPQIVANYATGDHGIPGEPATHTGADVVMQAGNSGNFQQWFYGFADENSGIMEGDHSVWKLSKDGTCPSNTFAMTVGPNNFWGDYLVQGATYCIRTNDFHQTK